MWRKRMFDLALLLPVLPLYALVTAAIAFLVWAVDGRPVLFLQERAGRHRRPFRIFKLRTMTCETDPCDRRPTRIGKLLRRRGLDELPQLLNILLGQMSLVGPRPLTVADAERLVAAHPPFAARFDLPPGLTGPAQVRNLRGVHRTAELEAAYAETRSAFGDVGLLARTIWINLAGKPKATAEATAVVRPPRHWLRRLFLAALVTIVGGWFAIAHEVNRLRLLKDRGGPAAFRTVDLASAAALNIVMAIGGYAFGYTEVADETLLLFAPTPNGERDFHSDFAMQAPAVRSAAKELVSRIARGEVHPSVAVSLDAPLGVRLALSVPFELRAEVADRGIDFTLRTHIIYPRTAVLPLGPGPTGEPVLFDEGMYWALQERGWFHPYWANWHWTLPRGDRFESEVSQTSFREAATVAIWRTLTGFQHHLPHAPPTSAW